MGNRKWELGNEGYEVRNGECGEVGNGEWGMDNEKWRVGNGKWKVRKWRRGMGKGKWGVGTGSDLRIVQ